RRPRVERATGPVDAIHVTANAMPPRTAPIVVTCNDLAFLHDPSHFTKHGVRFFKRSLSLALNEADLVLCSSRATLRDCRDAGFGEDRLRLVPLGVAASPAPDADVEDARRRYGLGRPYVLWVGTVEPRKNLRTLLKAFVELERGDDLDLVLVGPRGWREDLEELIRPAQGNVKTLGFVPGSDMASLYAGAEVFCYPSLLEGFGFPVLEAMVQGTPVVTSAGTATEELADGAGVLVEPTDPASVAAGIEGVLRDAGLAARLAGEGPVRAAAYTWARTAELVAAAYAEVTRSR
ncbi:MAG: glycosyltransferase family 4 protein, partial [Actinomycetota bacterium]